MIFKQWLNSLGQVQTVVNNLKNVEVLIDGGNNLLNSVSVTNLSNAISGLNQKQALLALSTKNLTEAQIKQVLAQAGLLENTISLTTAQATERISKQLNSEADANVLIKKYALITQQKLEKNSTLEVSAAKLNEAVANGALSKSEASVIANAYGISLANGTQTASFKLLTTAIWQNVKAMAAWLVSNPAGWATLAVTAIAALGAGMVYLSNSVERAKKKAKEAAETYAEIQSEIKDINSELQTTKNRIDELNAKQNITLIEAEELTTLKRANIELERELRLREAIAIQKGKEANDAAINYFGSKSNYGTTAGTIDITGDQIDILDYQIEKIKELEEYFKNDPMKDFLYIQNEKLLKFLQKETAKTIEIFMEQDDSLMEGYDEGFLKRLEIVYNKYDEIINGVAQSHTNTISGILEKVDFQDDANKLIELGESGKLSISTLSSRFPELIAYLEEAGVSAEELYQYIMALSNPDAINYDEVKKQFLTKLLNNNPYVALDSVANDLVTYAKNLVTYIDLENDGFLDNQHLEAFLTVRAKYTDEETEYWNIEDWKRHIQDELSFGTNANEPLDLSKWFESNTDSLDKFQSSVKSAADAYTTLLTGNYSSSELLDSIQAINKAASDMGKAIDWEAILYEYTNKSRFVNKSAFICVFVR